ncbi:MAG: cell wall-binding repeat-containing protein [Gracilibacteraceae bacterium]|jgi:uncharacterized protein with FMN-binding domain|nr:cell wall-binding repeat-containing protein [Gracilibacteraceae bacterium]
MNFKKPRGVLALLLAALLLTCFSSPALVLAAGGDYQPGVYEGSAQGRNGAVTLSVTVDGDNAISAIAVTAHQETTDYWNQATAVIAQILSAQGVSGVDAVSGATLSSRAIINATASALAKADPAVYFFAGGSGTSADPYTIADAAQLGLFRDAVNAGTSYAGKHIALSEDIDISGEDWTPIGSANAPTATALKFAGSFDGGGHTVSGLTIGAEDDPASLLNAGFFAILANTATVKNLSLTEVSIYNAPTAASWTGALAALTEAGSADGGGTVVDRVSVTGDAVSAVGSTGIARVGGLLGTCGTYISVTNSYTDITVTAEVLAANAPYAGGLTSMGGNYGLIANCYALGDVYAVTPHANQNSGVYAGGLIGMQSGKVYNCYAGGDVTVTGNQTTNSATQFTGAGALSGQLIRTTGGMYYVSYDTEAVITVNGIAADPAPPCGIGTPSASKEPENAAGYAGSDAEDREKLTARLNIGVLRAGEATLEVNPNNAREAVVLPAGVSLLGWEAAGDGFVWTEAIDGGDGEPGDIFDSGSGTEDDPYVVADEDQLRAFATSLTPYVDYAGRYVVLDADITLTGGDWMPIGEGEYPFAGVFDGGGHTISGLTYESDGEIKNASDTFFIGFFGVLSGTAKNLTLTEVDIHAVGKVSLYTGALTGYMETSSVVDSVFVSGEIYSETLENGNNFAGGIAGSMYRGLIVNSGSDAFVSSVQRGGAWSEVGGITAMNNRGSIINCYSFGDVYSWASRALEAGIAASNLAGFQAGDLVNSYATGNLTTSDQAWNVGAVSGDTTGIGKGYFLYYNSEAHQDIAGQIPDPVIGVGLTAKTQDEENPEIIVSGFNHELKAFTADYLKSQEFADLLNGNLAAFPLDPASLPQGVALKTWEARDGRILPVGAAAELTYVPVTIIDDTPPAFQAGRYLGRDGDKTQLVSVTVSNDAVLAVALLAPAEVEGSAELIAQIIDNPNGAGSLTPATPALAALREAITTALGKAKIGDATGYGAADPAAVFAGGSGTESDPYQIASETQLRTFAAAINEDEHFTGRYVALTADITLTGEWVPAGGGNADHAFAGNLDGGGHVVSGMTVGSADRPANYRFIGLLGYADEVVIKNIRLTDVSVNNVYTGTERSFAGTLAGGVDYMSHFDNCAASGEISHLAAGTNSAFVGGLIGFASGYGNLVTMEPDNSYSVFITNFATDVDIYGQSYGGWVYAGGLLGNDNRTYIANGYALGDVTVYSGGPDRDNLNRAAAGGISGFGAGYVSNVYTAGNMTSLTNTTDVGGYAGRHTGIATTEFTYYNSEAAHRSGNTVLSPTPGVGFVVPASSGRAPDLTPKTAAELTSAEFAALLNANLENISIGENLSIGPLADTVWDLWIFDGGAVVLDMTAPAPDEGEAEDPVVDENQVTVSVKPSVTEEGVAVANIDAAVEKALEKINSQQGEELTNIIIKVEAPPSGEYVAVKKVEAQLRTDLIQSVADSAAQSLTVASPVGEITLNMGAMESLLQEAAVSDSIVFSVGEADVEQEQLSPAQQSIMNNGAAVFDISIAIGGAKTDIRLSSGKFTIKLPYVLLDSGKRPQVRYFAPDGTAAPLETAYQSGSVIFETDHLSLYAIDTVLAEQDIPARSPTPNGGSGSEAQVPVVPETAAPGVIVSKASLSYISGQNRVETSLAISRRGWTSANAVIIAPGGPGNLIDALAVAPLAGQENAPILLSMGSIDPAVIAEIQRLGAKKIYVVGALNSAAVDALKRALPDVTVETLTGADRFETAALVNAKLTDRKGTFVIGYNATADAVSAASFAAANGYAIQIAGPDGSLSGAPVGQT